jgi:CRISPR system Cascade subunit CasA
MIISCRDESRWQELLRGLTPEFPGDEPWTLVVGDLSKPAFLQPPVPEGAWEVLKDTEVTPDALDMLVTSKNHDLKAARLETAAPEHWLFALITLQTWEGFLGRGNYGISRMNGGFASRPFIGVAPAMGGWGAHVARDILTLVNHRTEIIESDTLHTAEGGRRLLWLEPWDGQTSCDPSQLDPYYVEICRRVRLRNEGDRIVAHRGSSSAARINQPKGKHQGKDFTLPTGDPWTPVEKDSGKPLTLDGSGFHYRRVVNLLDVEKFNPAPLQLLFDTGEKGEAQIVFTAIVRGQGETQGFHERRVQVPERLKPVFMRKSDSVDMARIARDRVSDVAKVVSKALRPALFALYQAAPEKLDFNDPKAKSKAELFINQFERAVDEDFFEHLFEEAAEPIGSTAATACRKRWIELIWQRARDALAAAEAGSPLSGVRRYRARAAATGLLDGEIVDAFPDLLKRKPAA